MFLNPIELILQNAYIMLRLSGGTGSFPRILNAEEEKDCLERFAGGDIQARNTLIEHNLRLVAHIIKKYYTASADQDDLISIGTIGLIKGITTFNAEKGARLATYAARCIENEILMHFRSQKRQSSEVSLSNPIDTDKDGNTLSLMDIVYEEDNVLERLDSYENERQLRKFINDCLDEREKRIIVLRYGLATDEPLTQKEVAKLCSISRSYVYKPCYRKWMEIKSDHSFFYT